MSSYDLQQAQREAAALEQTVRAYKARLMPRQAFSFAAARAKQPPLPDDEEEGTEEAEAVALPSEEKVGVDSVISEPGSNFVHLADYTDSRLELQCDGLLALKLTRLRRTTVRCSAMAFMSTR